MRNKPKFKKSRCLKCKYHGIGHGSFSTKVDDKSIQVYCNYATIAESTCLKPINNKEVIDMRGEDYYNCLLFSEGAMIKEKNI